MPESPDFDRIFERIALRTGAFQVPLEDVHAAIVEQLRLVWNARGAADLARLELSEGVSLKEMARALRSLDR